MLSYDEWYDKIGYRMQEVYEEWQDLAPSDYLLEDIPSVEEYLIDEYEGMISDYMDRAYDEYKDDKLMEGD
jgi:hypothetical protein